MTGLVPETFSEPVAHMLRKYAARVLPLTRHDKPCEHGDDDDAAAIQRRSARSLFPQARAPEAAASGLLLLLGCWEESHTFSQEIASPEGSYWHAIAHRMEPDAANSAYWFRRVGEHPVFPDLLRSARGILERIPIADWRLKKVWDPFLFIEWCEEARLVDGTDKERAALAIQRAEWELLFAWCSDQASS